MFRRIFELLSGSESEENNKEEMSKCGLNSDEQKAVENDDYDNWNFEEEDLEEDDYYYEDDETSLYNDDDDEEE